MKMERCLKLCKGIFLALAWIIAQSLSAQTITVSGNVSDVSGEPLIGVTIQVEIPLWEQLPISMVTIP